ncbi:hypothetical protein Tco_0145467 [Tanacetum coccineum]
MARKEDTRDSFNKLMDTPLDFSAFVMNQLKVDTLTPELLAEVCKATTDKLDWNNPEGQSDLKRLPTYSAYPNPRGFIYQNKDKKNKLMHIDELHKFHDDTLNDVRTALDDILKRIRMKYLPQRYWKKVDKDRAGAMIQAIDKMLKNRRIMRSLEKFVGGRPYKGDFRLLQRTI